MSESVSWSTPSDICGLSSAELEELLRHLEKAQDDAIAYHRRCIEKDRLIFLYKSKFLQLSEQFQRLTSLTIDQVNFNAKQ